jgi:hypothetical protein
LVPEGAAPPQQQVDVDELSLPEGVGDDNFLIVDQDENEEPPGLEIRTDDSDSEDEDEPKPNVQQSCSGHTLKPNQKVFGQEWLNYQAGKDPKQKLRAGALNDQYLNALNWKLAINLICSNDMRGMMALMHENTDPEYNTVKWMHPMLLGAKANSEDNPTWEEAMNGPNQKGYWEACEKELNTLDSDKNAWDIVDCQPWMNVLPSTWVFKCKRFPSGDIRKLKARFCVRGDRQVEGVNCFDTFAPVVNWTTVRLMLILSIVLGLSTKQVDYTAAFVHAPIDKDPNWDNLTKEEQQKCGVYIDMPRGFSQPGKVLKLN